jgi:hypothetical protein
MSLVHLVFHDQGVLLQTEFILIQGGYLFLQVPKCLPFLGFQFSHALLHTLHLSHDEILHFGLLLHLVGLKGC